MSDLKKRTKWVGPPAVPLQRKRCITPPLSTSFSHFIHLSPSHYTLYIQFNILPISLALPLTVSCTWSDSRDLQGRQRHGLVAQGGAGMEQSQNSQLLHGLQRLELFNEIRSESDTELIWQTPDVPCQLIPINLSSKSRQVGQWWAWRLEWEAAASPSELEARFMYFCATKVYCL